MLIGSVLLMTACAWPADDSSDRSPNPNLSPTDPQTASDEALVRAIDPDGLGCAAAVARAGEVVWSGGRGLADVELETPITADTHFDLGSVSKHTTALTVLALASEGLIDIDGTVDQYASELGDWTSDTTVRDLMLHRSGLPDYIELLIEAGQTLDVAASQDDALAALENVSAGRN